MILDSLQDDTTAEVIPVLLVPSKVQSLSWIETQFLVLPSSQDHPRRPPWSTSLVSKIHQTDGIPMVSHGWGRMELLVALAQAFWMDGVALESDRGKEDKGSVSQSISFLF